MPPIPTITPTELEPRYENANDVAMRLSGTIVRYKEEPVYVWEVETVSQMLICPLLKKTVLPAGKVWVNPNDADLDLSSPSLGWINRPSGVQYVCRDTTNSQKQGVNPKGLFVFIPPSNMDASFRWRELSDLEPIAKAIVNDYPSLSSVIRGGVGGAISRDFALISRRSDIWSVYFKTDCIGVFSLKRNKFSFLPGTLTKTRTMRLQEILSKEGVNYAIES